MSRNKAHSVHSHKHMTMRAFVNRRSHQHHPHTPGVPLPHHDIQLPWRHRATQHLWAESRACSPRDRKRCRCLHTGVVLHVCSAVSPCYSHTLCPWFPTHYLCPALPCEVFFQYNLKKENVANSFELTVTLWCTVEIQRPGCLQFTRGNTQILA